MSRKWKTQAEREGSNTKKENHLDNGLGSRLGIGMLITLLINFTE